MNLLFTSLILTLMLPLTGFASATPSGCDDDMNLYREVINLVNDEPAIQEMKLNEMAEVTFTISDDHSIHVVQVLTKDSLFEFHIRQKLEGVKVNNCFENNHAYTILVNARLV